MQKKSVTVFVGLFVLSLLTISLMADFVVAQSSSAIFDPVKDMFTGWTEGRLSDNIAKYLLFILVSIFIYTILDYTPFLKGKDRAPLRTVAAVIIAFLGTAYLTLSDIHLILASYTALGFVLSAIIPFIVLLFGSIEVHKSGGAMGRIGVRLVWFAFIVFLVAKVIGGIASVSEGGVRYIGGVQGTFYLIFIGLSVIWIFYAEREFIKWYFKEEFETQKSKLEREIRAQSAKRKIEAEEFMGGGGI